MPPRDKLYRIGDAAALLEVRTSVLRFWETEFAELAPTRLPSGHRAYTEKDVQLLKRIKNLLHTKGMTIEGAKQVLARSGAGSLTEEQKQERMARIEERKKVSLERRRVWTARKRAGIAAAPAAADQPAPAQASPDRSPEVLSGILAELREVEALLGGAGR